MLCMLGKIFSRRHFEILSSISQRMGFGILCRLSPKENLHEMSNPSFEERLGWVGGGGGGGRKIDLSSAKLA